MRKSEHGSPTTTQLEKAAPKLRPASARNYAKGQKSLYLLCRLDNARMDIARDIIAFHPFVAGLQDAFGWLPLHYACANKSHSAEFIELLVNEFPEGVAVQNIKGLVPLHLYLILGATNVMIQSPQRKLPQCLREMTPPRK
jgi:ankyrin repeat protein